MNRIAIKPNIQRLLILLAIFALVLPLPINDDNGFWQSMAQDILFFGRWPYLQCWDHSFPGPLLIHMPIIFFFGRSDIAFRAADVAIQLSFCWLLYRLSKIWMSDRTAWLTVLMYALYYARSAPGVGGEKDVYAMIFVFAGTFLIFRRGKFKTGNSSAIPPGREKPEFTFAGAGLLVGLATLIKPMNILFLVPLMIFLPELRGLRSRIILLGCGVFPLALSFLIFAFKPDGFHAYWMATIPFNMDVYATISHPFSQFLRWFISPKVLAIPLVAGVIALFVGHKFRFDRAPARNERAIYLSFLLLALAIVLMQRKYYGYQFVMVIALLTPIAAHGIESVLESAWVRRHAPQRVAAAALFTFLGLLTLPYETVLHELRNHYPSESFAQILNNSLNYMVWQNPSDAPTLAYFSQPERRNASLEVASFDPRLRFRLARPMAGKYPTLEALGYRTNPNDPHAFTNYQHQWRRAYIDTLRARRPEYIIISRAPSAEYLQDPYADVLHYLDGFDSLLQSAYSRDTIIGTNDIYRLKEMKRH